MVLKLISQSKCYIEKSKPIKGQPPYRFDPSKHRWILNEFNQDLANASARGIDRKDVISNAISKLIDNGALHPEARKLPLKQQYAIVYGFKDKVKGE